MTRGNFYLSIILVFAVGLLAVAVQPELTLAVLTVGIPLSILAALVSTLYLARIYRLQPVPRSRFFGMLLETFYALLFVGGWVGYLSVARLTQRLFEAGELGWFISAPPPAVTSPISALVVIVTFAAPVRFALEIFRTRRRVPPATPEELHGIDPEDEPPAAVS